MSTHHCPCTTLLLYLPPSTPLSSLSHRQPPILDKAAILPLPPSNSTSASSPKPRIIHSTLDKKPLVIRREDGFEKRWLRRCARCGVVWGYELVEPEGQSRVEDGGEGEEGKQRVGRVLYVLEEGVVGTVVLERSLLEGGGAERR